MTRLLLFSLALAAPLLVGCAADAPADAPATEASSTDAASASSSAGSVTVGEPIDGGLVVLTADEVAARAAELDGQELTVEGDVSEVCQQKGCWLTFATASGEPFRVAVPKDEAGEYVYTFPTDVAGRRARIAGTFSVEEESVETLRHLAEDAGQSAEEVAAITEPKRTLSLTASGAELAPADA